MNTPKLLSKALSSIDPYYKEVAEISKKEQEKTPNRYDIINYLLDTFHRKTTYLEIGVRNPSHNFKKIHADEKYGVDPGIEFEENPVDFPLTSDDFFNQLREGKELSTDIQFDVIFIDGMHLADQVDRDIHNALDFIKDDGFIVLHDCNPPTEWHARESHRFIDSPAKFYWNGTTWKAFYKWRSNTNVFSCCIDSDWGVGVISKTHPLGSSIENTNPYYEFHVLENDRKNMLNLVDFETFKSLIKK